MKPTDDRRSSETALVLPWRGEVTVPCGRALKAARPLGRAATASRWREALDACGAFEWVALAYLGLTGALILVFRHNLPGAQVHSSVIAGLIWFAGQAGVATLIVALSWTTQRRSSAVLRFVRHWYPQAFFLFCFEELHYLVHLVFPGWFDRWLIGFDHSLAGVHPTVWLEQFARPALNDFMQMAYLSYFFYLPILAGILYARGEVRAFWAVMTSSMAAYTIGYLISIFFPVESPYHSLAALQRVESDASTAPRFPRRTFPGRLWRCWGRGGIGAGCSGPSFRFSCACSWRRCTGAITTSPMFSRGLSWGRLASAWATG